MENSRMLANQEAFVAFEQLVNRTMINNAGQMADVLELKHIVLEELKKGNIESVQDICMEFKNKAWDFYRIHA